MSTELVKYWVNKPYIQSELVTADPSAYALMFKAEDVARVIAGLQKDIEWLNEFVTEPEEFPNEGDRQWWQERRAGMLRS